MILAVIEAVAFLSRGLQHGLRTTSPRLHLWKVVFTTRWAEEPSPHLFEKQKTPGLGVGEGEGSMEAQEENAPSRHKPGPTPTFAGGQKYSRGARSGCGWHGC